MNAEASGTEVTRLLAGFATEQAELGLPPKLQHEGERVVANALAASVAAPLHPAIQILLDWATGGGGRSPSPIIWTGQRSSTQSAAVVNAAMIHVLDFDDTYIPAIVHASAPVVGAALAEARLRSLGGDALLTSIVVGIEVACAVGEMLMPSHYRIGFHTTSTAGALGAAATCALLQELDAEHTQQALNIAANGAAGFLESIGTMSKSFGVGSAARTGLVAADLARRGFDGSPTVLEGRNGMLASMSRESKRHHHAILERLGTQWAVMRNSYKSYPTGVAMHAPLECVLRARSAISPVRALEATVIEVGVDPLLEQYWGSDTGGVKRLDEATPSNALQAKFNFRYCLAIAWKLGRFEHRDLEENLTDQTVLDLVPRIRVRGRPGMTMDAADVTISYRTGPKDTVSTPAHKGSPANPLSDHEIDHKFLAAAQPYLSLERSRAIWTLSGPSIARVIQAISLGSWHSVMREWLGVGRRRLESPQPAMRMGRGRIQKSLWRLFPQGTWTPILPNESSTRQKHRLVGSEGK